MAVLYFFICLLGVGTKDCKFSQLLLAAAISLSLSICVLIGLWFGLPSGSLFIALFVSIWCSTYWLLENRITTLLFSLVPASVVFDHLNKPSQELLHWLFVFVGNGLIFFAILFLSSAFAKALEKMNINPSVYALGLMALALSVDQLTTW